MRIREVVFRGWWGGDGKPLVLKTVLSLIPDGNCGPTLSETILVRRLKHYEISVFRKNRAITVTIYKRTRWLKVRLHVPEFAPFIMQLP